MKIALIFLSANVGEIFPVGLMSLAGFLKQHAPQHQVEIIDSNFEAPYEKVLAGGYDLIGISSMTVEYEAATVLAEKLKKAITTPLVVGGVHISTMPTSLRQCFDIGVVGEGEETFCDLVMAFEKHGALTPAVLKQIPGLAFHENGKISLSPRRAIKQSLETFPPLDYSLVDARYFRFRALPVWGEFGREAILLTSRGCPYKCTFCSTTQFWDKVRYFSVPWVISQIKTLVNDYGVDHLQIFDDLFTIHKKRLRVIAEELKKEGLDKRVKLSCQSRANLVDDELCEILRSMNVEIVSFGFESGNERILKYLKGDNSTVEQNKNAVDLCVKHGFRVLGSVIFGSPTETLEEMRDTMDFIAYTKKAGADRIWSFVATPFPETQMWETALARGKVSHSMNFDALTHGAVDNPLLLDESIDKNAFKELFLENKKQEHYYKWKKFFTFMRNDPVRTTQMALNAPWPLIRRMFVRSDF